MAATYWDMARRSGTESWRRLRHMRSASFISTRDLDLRDTFAMSLQQAEQQFGAAKMVGYESRPLNLFYGLSQAGRAVAVAAHIGGATNQPLLSGHGIKCTNLSELAVDPVGRFGQLRIRSLGQDNTSFRRLSQVLASNSLDQEVELKKLWGLLVEPHMHEPLPATQHAFLHTNYYPDRADSNVASLTLSSVPADVNIEDPTEFTNFIALYPSLAGSQLLRAHPFDNRSTRESSMRSVDLIWPDGSKAELDRACTVYRNSRVIYPVPHAGTSPLHPLMAWWAVLFALSMLARYEPRTWTRLVDVDFSPHAVSIEFLLDVAQESVPDILAETIERLIDGTTT